MADDQTQTVDPNEQQAALVQQLLRQTLSPQAYQPQEPPHSGDNRTWGSLLGQALVGGAGPGSTDAANEQAGLRALQSIGLGMMQGSDYSQARHSLGSIVANAIGGAQESNYAQNAAQLEYQKTQQELQLARVKEAVPLLTLLQTQQQLANARNLALGKPPTAPGANVNLGAVGPVPSGILTPNEQPINAAGDSATRKAAEGGPPAPGTPAAKIAQQVHDFWIGKGYSEPVVAGIMAGGPGSESNFDPTASGDKGTSIGLYQHHAERLDGMRKFFNLSADQMPTADQQNQYAAWEISPQGPKAAVGAALSKAQTPAEAAAIWTRSFGVPADKSEIGRRAAGAGRYLGLYGQPQPPGAPGAPPTAQTPPAASTGAQALPVPPIPPAQPPGVSGTPLPAGRPTGPPIITDQPTGSATVAGPAGTATLGQPLPPSPAVLGDVNAIIGGMTGAGTNATTLAPGPGSAAPAAPLATQAQVQPHPPPAVETTPPPGPPRVPDVPPPYVRGPLPPDIQAQIDHPQIDPQFDQSIAGASTVADIQAANLAKAAAIAKARAEAQTRAEAYHTAQQSIATEAWKVRRAEQAATDTALQKQGFDERQATISSANTRLNAEAADQTKHNTEVITTVGNNADAATRVRGSLAQARSLLTSLPGNPSSLLSNETTRPIVAGLFGGILPTLDTKATNADLFVNAINRAATDMSPKTLIGGERSSNVTQYKAMLPGLATSPEGRELALNFADDMAENQQKAHEWLVTHKEDASLMNKRLGVPDLDKAMVAMRADPSMRMPSLPPVPPSYDAKAAAANPDFKTASDKYKASIQPGQDYYAWQAGSDGRLHAVKNTWTRGDGGWTLVRGSAP